jgi:hypothetical protein
MIRKYVNGIVVISCLALLGSSGNCNRQIPEHCFTEGIYVNIVPTLTTQSYPNSLCPNLFHCAMFPSSNWYDPFQGFSWQPEQKRGEVHYYIQNCTRDGVPIKKTWNHISVTPSSNCYTVIGGNKQEKTIFSLKFFSACEQCQSNKRTIYNSSTVHVPPNTSWYNFAMTLDLNSIDPSQILGNCN